MFAARAGRLPVHDAVHPAHRRGIRSRLFLASLGAALTGALLVGPVGLSPAQAATNVTVVVQERPGAGPSVEKAITQLGGHVDLALPIIDGVSATVPADRIATLEANPGVIAVTVNRPVSFSG